MTITIRLFAVLRDRAGLAQLQLELPNGTSAADASRRLAVNYPDIEPYLSKTAFAVNQQYASPATELHDGDELALIPPVSGG
jgi:molybdopterin converting factor subunit 1